MNQSTITVDVREDIRNGREPFAKITSAAAQLTSGQTLLLIAPFEPVPLYHVLARQGFGHSSRRNDSGDWEVQFTRDLQSALDNRSAADEEVPRRTDLSLLVSAATEIVELDARGLEPPQPMVKILETLTSLPAGVQLRASTNRRPVHLYPMLEERGFTAQTEEQPDGSFITNIRHN